LGKRATLSHLPVVRTAPLASRVEPKINRPEPIPKGEPTMKKLILAVALVVACAAPAMAETFPNTYMTR
jgi:hypothetical protein